MIFLNSIWVEQAVGPWVGVGCGKPWTSPSFGFSPVQGLDDDPRWIVPTRQSSHQCFVNLNTLYPCELCHRRTHYLSRRFQKGSSAFDLRHTSVRSSDVWTFPSRTPRHRQDWKGSMHFVKMSRNYFFAIGDLKGGFSERSHLVAQTLLTKVLLFSVLCWLTVKEEKWAGVCL